ncbi:MAG: nuclear transport factor 2 family protein [Candidatus Eremiobacteraeota bacterium]|nr:nuclear transport factor 2 family protein [Candidatus Eremiobacteraeota bacterium]
MTNQEMLEALIGAWKAGDAHRAAAFFTEDAVYQEAKHGAIIGREALVAHFVRFFRDGPLWRFEPEELVMQGERAALSYRFAVKGQDQSWREGAGCAMIHVHGGLVALWREYEG